MLTMVACARKKHGKLYPTFFHFFSEKLLMQNENAKEYNRTTSRFEPRLVYMHTPKPKKIISNAC